jgi:ketosteroid isomerase-like protein
MDVSDELAIRSLHARYAQGVDRGRFAETAALFAPDAALEVEGSARVVGRDAIQRYFEGVGDTLEATSASRLIRHHVTSAVVDAVDDDHARGAVYFLAVTERGVDHWGRYRDEYVRLTDSARDPREPAGGWRFSERICVTEGRAAGSWAAENPH